MTPTRRRLLAMAVSLPLIATSGTGQGQSGIVLPDFSDPSLAVLSRDDEERLGAAVVDQLRRRRALIDNVALEEYLGALGHRLALHADTQGRPLSFFWIKSSQINAFAAPGGYIGINAGLMLATRDEAELAGVVAHEIAHVTQRHIARRYAEMQNMALPMAAAMVASALVAAASREAGQAAMAGSLALGAQQQINFTRAHEQEADRVGVRLLARAGFDPSGMQRFFDRMSRLAGSQNALMDLLRTHPRAEMRSADVAGRTDLPQAATSVNDPLAYTLAMARLRVIMADNVMTLIRGLETTLPENGVGDTGDRFALALAYSEAARFDQAEAHLDRLLATDPERLDYGLLAAELALARGQDDKAMQRFDALTRLYSDDYRLAISYGSALIRTGQPQAALAMLKPQQERRPRDPRVHWMVSEAAQAAGDSVAASMALAEYHYLAGELDLAVLHAGAAARNPSATPFQEAKARARLAEFEAEKAVMDKAGSP